MFSLDWVSIKAQIMGPAHLINDYVEYGPILDKEVSRQQNLTVYETKPVWLFCELIFHCHRVDLNYSWYIQVCGPPQLQL